MWTDPVGGSLELLDEIERVAAARDLVQDILLEVNIGREEAKSGFAPEEVLAGAEAAAARTHVRVQGLMTIPLRMPIGRKICGIFRKCRHFMLT